MLFKISWDFYILTLRITTGMYESIHINIKIIDVWIWTLCTLLSGLITIYDNFWISHSEPSKKSWDTHLKKNNILMNDKIGENNNIS